MTDFNAPSDRDVNRAIRSWLHEDRHEDVSRVAGAVLDQVETTRQRRATWWPARRFLDMNAFAKVFVSAAALVAVAVVGINLLPRNGSGGVGSQPSATATPTASPQPTPAPLPTSGAIDAGTYLMTDGVTSFSVTIPPGWDAAGDGREIWKHRDQPNEVGFGIYAPDINVWADACDTEDAPPPTGPTMDDLITALRAQANSDVSAGSALLTDSRPGMRLDVSVPDGLDLAGCFDGVVRIWVDGSGSYLAGLGPNGTAPVTIVEALTGRMVYYTANDTEATPPDLAELQAIVDSIQFEPGP